jgi:NitT/TauT family transport system substrate-binding protein
MFEPSSLAAKSSSWIIAKMPESKLNNGRSYWRLLGLTLLTGLCVASHAPANAQLSEFRVGRQPGMIYLPLYVMEEQDLLAKHAVRLGIAPAKLKLVNLGSASAINETLLSGSVEAVAGAITPLLTLWDKTNGAQKVKAIVSLSNSNLYLNSNDPKLKSLKDFTEQHRIALSGVGVSMQATLLQMASAQAFGEGQEKRLDPMTVSMPHPEGLVALLSGNVIAAHFTTAPFQNLELRDSKIHRVLTSNDILGGYAPAALVFTMQSVYAANPKLIEAFVAAADEANAWILKNPRETAELYLRKEPQKLSVDEIKELLGNGDTRFSTTPENSLKIATFMAKLGRLKTAPASWKDYFFPVVSGDGS